MCGLVGVISDQMIMSDVKVFHQLLLADVMRGVHSTGYCAVEEKTGDAVVRKKAVPSYDFLDMSRMTDKMDTMQRALLGHNRHATQGASGSSNNAHPFEHGDIVLMHNGSLSSRRGLAGKGFAVDSEQIAYTFSVADDPKKIISELHGAFALVWYDKRDCCIRIVRNSQRPLWFAVDKSNHNSTTYYYASEKKMLEWVLERNNVQISSISEVKPGCLWTINPDMSIDHEEVGLYAPPPPAYQQSWYGTAGSMRLPPSVGKSGFSGATNDALVKMGLSRGDSVYFDVDKSMKSYTSTAKKTSFTYEGRLLEDVDVVVKAYGQDEDPICEFYQGSIVGAYIDRQDNNRLVLSVNSVTPMLDWEPQAGRGNSDGSMECCFCGDKIGQQDEFHVLEDGVMHHACFVEYQKLFKGVNAA